MMELLGAMPVSMTLRGKHTPRFFEREGRYLKRIKQLNYWPLSHVLVEKYDMDPAEVSIFWLNGAPYRRLHALGCAYHGDSGASMNNSMTCALRENLHDLHLWLMQAQGLSQFLLRMLRFHPETRATAQDLLSDPWLEGKLPEAPAELHDLASRKRRRPDAVSKEQQGSAVPASAAAAEADGVASAVEATSRTPAQPDQQQEQASGQASTQQVLHDARALD
jgi:hypothetical protein